MQIKLKHIQTISMYETAKPLDAMLKDKRLNDDQYAICYNWWDAMNKLELTPDDIWQGEQKTYLPGEDEEYIII